MLPSPLLRVLTVLVVIFSDQIHPFEQLVQLDEWAYQNQRAQHTPQPKMMRSDFVIDAASF